MNEPAQITVGWKISAIGLRMASVRYRALLPVLALRRFSSAIESKVFSDMQGVDLRTLDVLVLVKALTLQEVEPARIAADLGVAVVFDLCDNIFMPGYDPRGFEAPPAEIWRMLLPHLDLVTVPTEALADVVRTHAGTVPVCVIPDGSENASHLPEMQRLLDAIPRQQRRTRLRKLADGLKRLFAIAKVSPSSAAKRLQEELHARGQKIRYLIRLGFRRQIGHLQRWNALRAMKATGTGHAKGVQQSADYSILWFGNHGGEYASFGMLDLLAVRRPLEAVAREYDVELVVVSNHAAKFEANIRPFAIPTRYVEWSPAALQQELARASVVIVPNSLDPFSACKSANRTVLSLEAGVPVVATRTSALAPLADVVRLDDMEAGLRNYLQHPERALADVARARPLIESLFGLPAIAALWQAQIEHLMEIRQPAFKSGVELAIVVNLAQDMDLALPVARRAREAGLRVELWASTTVLRRSPRVASTLEMPDLVVRSVPDILVLRPGFEFPQSLRAILTISETSLGPHVFTHRLTRAAQSCGIFVATMQHGFENVGLTYSDAVHPVKDVEIAADRIYLWGDADSLHPHAAQSVRQRSVAAGCTKPAHVSAAPLEGLLPSGKPVVGVFENLHWHRYSTAYRHAFVKNVQSLAHQFPNVTFLVKPHHAGMWLTHRHRGLKPDAANIVIADPAVAAWEPYTASALLGHLSAVITSPSTVALDAARHGLPTAVVAIDLGLENYNPLTLIRQPTDWTAFVGAVLEPVRRAELLASSASFVRRALASEDGVGSVVADLASVVRTANEKESRVH